MFKILHSILRASRAADEARQALAEEAERRREAEQALRAMRDHLEERVVERTVELEHELSDCGAAEAEARAAQEEAEQANRAKSEFLASIGHELRTPLNAVIGFSELIRSETHGPVGDGKYLDYAQDIHQAGRQLLAIIDDILDLSKIEAGMAELRETEIDVFRVVEACMTIVRERARSNRIILDQELPTSLPPLYADETRLKQILVNLLFNAVEFSAPGDRVTLAAWADGDKGYIFQVTDTGAGLTEEAIRKALAPFGRVENDGDHKPEGSGLGLPLSKAIAELHGGSLALESRAGEGTTVTVRFLPQRIATPDHQHP